MEKYFAGDIDVAVIGAGHAGIEAALAAARMGLRTVLFTLHADAVANMPCNPSIGGSGKGQLVYEIDALGGEMGYAADKVTLQDRILNSSRGAAVQSKRIQADRAKYRDLMKNVLENTENLTLIQAEIADIRLKKDKNGKKCVDKVITRTGAIWKTKTAIICAGTYLRGKVICGDVAFESGPDGLHPSNLLKRFFEREKIPMMRFKTGTPPRIDKHTVDFSKLEEQPSEEYVTPFSMRTNEVKLQKCPKIPCYITYTNEKTHDIIRNNLHRSPLFSGVIDGTGPRYCPSIEDKIVRFADKTRHQIFVEPMGSDSGELYLQGLSSSLPEDVQVEMVHSLPGFENAQIMRYAYAIEYDCVDATALKHTLEFKEISGLFGAGQFNGTSGYEEAAAQGLIAGMNAALMTQNKEQIVLERSSSYIGALIDDIVTKGTGEPYRMMTSRTEYRLILRQDNAHMRLCDIGYKAGLVTQEAYKRYLKYKKLVENEKKRLESTVVSPNDRVNALLESIDSPKITTGIRLSELLRRQNVTYENVAEIDTERKALPNNVILTAVTDIKYDGYIKKQLLEVKKQQKLEKKQFPYDIDFKKIKGISTEAAQKLDKFRPANIGEASRISGISPADISVLLIYLSMYKKDNDDA